MLLFFYVNLIYSVLVDIFFFNEIIFILLLICLFINFKLFLYDYLLTVGLIEIRVAVSKVYYSPLPYIFIITQLLIKGV